jgi:hypothetical protein
MTYSIFQTHFYAHMSEYRRLFKFYTNVSSRTLKVFLDLNLALLYLLNHIDLP